MRDMDNHVNSGMYVTGRRHGLSGVGGTSALGHKQPLSIISVERLVSAKSSRSEWSKLVGKCSAF